MGNVSIAFQIHFRIISQTFLLFRLSGILGHLGHLQTRSKRSSESPMDIAKILPNHELCFAGHKLIFKVPKAEAKAEKSWWPQYQTEAEIANLLMDIVRTLIATTKSSQSEITCAG